MIQDWMRFCTKKGASFEVASRGIDILHQMEPDGSRPNIEYYMSHGWQALLTAAEESLFNPIPRWKS